MDKYYLLQDADYLTEVQVDMGDSAGGLQGGGEAIGGFFDFMKSFSESFSSLDGCSSNCVGGSLLSRGSEVVIENPEGLWALGISEQLYELNMQVLILTELMVLFIIAYLAKLYVIHKLKQRNKSINKGGKHE